MISTGATAVERFFEATAPLLSTQIDPIFCFLAVRQADEFQLVQARILVGYGDPKQKEFTSANIRAGCYPLSKLNVDIRSFVDSFLSGQLSLPAGPVRTAPPISENYSIVFLPLHPETAKEQTRVQVLRFAAGEQLSSLRDQELDWELLAATPPFGGLQELANAFQLGPIQFDIATFEIIVTNLAAIDINSQVSSRTARPTIRLIDGLPTDSASLSYRVYSQGKLLASEHIAGSAMSWTTIEGPPRVQAGSIELDVPEAAVVHCVAVFNGIAQNHRWLADPKNSQNPRRIVERLCSRTLIRFMLKPNQHFETRNLNCEVNEHTCRSKYFTRGRVTGPTGSIGALLREHCLG